MQYYQTRDLTRYKQIEFYLRNTTHTAIRGSLSLRTTATPKNIRRAISLTFPPVRSGIARSFRSRLPPGLGGDRPAGLEPNSEIDFTFEPQTAMDLGRLYLDDLVLVEPADRWTSIPRRLPRSS